MMASSKSYKNVDKYLYVRWACSAKISAAVSYISCLQQDNSTLANVSAGQVGGPISSRNAKRLKLVPMPPVVSVNAKLCRVTGSSSGSLRGGRSLKINNTSKK